MNDRLPELSTGARALIEAGKAAEPLPPGVAARVWGRVATGMPPAPVASPPAPATTFTVFKLVGVSLGILGIGAVATVAVVRLRPRSPSPTVLAPQTKQMEAPPPVAPIAAMLPSVPEKAVEPPPATRAVPAVSAHSPSKIVPAPRFPNAPDGAPDSNLAAERSLIARARSSLEKGLPLDALATLRMHEQRFERGALAQEREALRIQALIAAGNRPAAEAAAARFERDYPQSLMGPAVRAALGTKP